MKNKSIISFVFLILALALNISCVYAVASFQISSFSCSPSESAINSLFSCTAQINNIGDAAGTVNTATLYPDSNDWLENSNYPQSSGASVSPGQTTEVTFTGLRAVKSGKYGFSKIMLDSVTDTFVSDNNIRVNVIDVSASVSNSVSSAAMNSIITSSVEVTAGGNIDVILTLTISSGGCSIGSQGSQKTISGMQNGNKQSRSWTITQGTSGSCVFSISAAATGEGGVATKTSSNSNTITCTNCPTTVPGALSSSSGSGSGGGGGGGIGKTIKNLGELNIIQTIEISSNENVKFNISGIAHSVSVINVTETKATIVVESKQQTFVLSVGEEKEVDLNEDNKAEIKIKVKSINILTKKVKLELTPILENIAPGSETPGSQQPSGSGTNEGTGTSQGSGLLGKNNNLTLLLIIILGIVMISVIIYFIYRITKKKKYR